MARIANRGDVNGRFKSTMCLWPSGGDCIINIPASKTRADFPLPLRFNERFSHQLDAIVYSIDEQDNALEILLEDHGQHPSISFVSLSEMEDFYCIEKSMRISLRYVGHGIFFFSLFDKGDADLELVPVDDSYVPAILPNAHLEYIENELHLKYIPQVAAGLEAAPIEMSSDSNSSEVSELPST